MPKRYFVNKLLSATETNVPLEWNYWSGVLTEYTQLIENRVPPVPKNADGGLYVGTPGIAYLFYRLIKSPLTASHKNDFIKRGLKYITSAQPYVESQRARNATDFIGFILGPAGFQAIAAAFYTAAGTIRRSFFENISFSANLRMIERLSNQIYAFSIQETKQKQTNT